MKKYIYAFLILLAIFAIVVITLSLFVLASLYPLFSIILFSLLLYCLILYIIK